MLSRSYAIAISDNDAARLIQEHFPRLQASELKYRSLVRRTGYRQPLLELQRTVLSDYKCVTYICDKRFLLFADVPGLRRRALLL